MASRVAAFLYTSPPVARSIVVFARCRRTTAPSSKVGFHELCAFTHTCPMRDVCSHWPRLHGRSCSFVDLDQVLVRVRLLGSYSTARPSGAISLFG